MLGISQVWSKAAVFEAVITGSNPVSPAKWKRARVWFIGTVLKTVGPEKGP